MAAVNGSRRLNGRRPKYFGRTSLSTAFVQALRDTRTTRSAAARLLGVTTRTIRRWLNHETPIAVELIAEVPKLATPFASCFSVLMKKQERAERRKRG